MAKQLCICLAFVLGASSVWASEDHLVSVDELLKRASVAIQEKNYVGRFTYEFGTTLETLEVVHAVKDGVEYERIQHLSGERREFVRSGRDQSCVSPGGSLLRGGLVPSGDDLVALAQNYHFYLRGNDRIAGRDAAVVQAVPKDEFRYGMTLALDESSGLPLMFLTTSSSAQNTLERFQFVQLDVDVDLDSLQLTPADATHQVLDSGKVDCASRDETQARWRAGWTPAGFVLSQSSRGKRGDDVLTYTDGIASFTLFIAPLNRGDAFKQGMARRGATIALMTPMRLERNALAVVFVGEVPAATAERVVSSIHPLPVQ